MINGVSLDGVMQSPGRPDEDTRDGFEHGGWAIPYSDQAMVAKMGERMGEDRAWLFGRRTYEDLLATWNARAARSRTRSTTLRRRGLEQPATPLEWPNSTLLHGDVPAAVATSSRAPARIS